MNKKILVSWILSRTFLCLIFTSLIQKDLFVPFLSNPNLSFGDPWSSWLDSSGRLDAFPYGYVMFLFFLPIILINKVLQVLSINFDFGTLVLLTLIIVEFYLFKMLRVFDMRTRVAWSRLVVFSPLPIYISYVHGQIDVLPTSLMTFAAILVLKNSWFKAGLAVGVALAAKFSFILAIPFFIIFFLNKPARRQNAYKFAKGAIPGALLLILPTTFSQGYQIMVLDTPEVLRTLDAKIDIGVSALYLVPIAYLLVFLVFWGLNQISNFVLVSFVGSAFSVIALTQTSSVGWFYWGIPLIFLALREASNRTLVLFAVWQLSVVLSFMFKELVLRTRFMGEVQLKYASKESLEGLLFTLNIVLGVVLIAKILKEAQKVGDLYLLSKKPLSLNVAGDSGVGKDTLSKEIAGLFDDQEVALLLGDDYHLHERGESSWLTTTHLSIDANDLESMGRDFQRLLARKPVFVKHYDHSVGRFTLPRKIHASQVVIVNGLHAHLIPGSEFTDLKVFLSMDEELRIQLKLERDVSQRQHEDENTIRESISARAPHYKKFVEPQKDNSDLHFHLFRISDSPMRLGIEIKSRDAAFIYQFRNAFNAVLDIPATLSKFEDVISLKIDPYHFKSADALLILKQNVESVDQLFSREPKFSDGSIGVLGLVTMLALTRKRRNYV